VFELVNNLGNFLHRIGHESFGDLRIADNGRSLSEQTGECITEFFPFRNCSTQRALTGPRIECGYHSRNVRIGGLRFLRSQ
jgi:hypothetical protein